MWKKIIILAVSAAMFAVISGCGATDAGLQKSSISGNLTEESRTEASATESSTEAAETTTEPEIASEKTEPKTTEAATENEEFTSIDGEWYIDGDPDAAHISISSSGRFTAYYAHGGIENTGYVRYERDEIDDAVSYWYVLYTDNDEIYMVFIDDGSERKLDFYDIYGEGVHYVWTSGVGGIADDGRGEDEICAYEKYVGTWGCGRATLTVSENDDGTYLGIIDWADSAFAYVEWVYTLTYDTESQSMVCNGSATKTYYQYEDENPLPLSDVMYTNGSGSFYAENDVLIWNDEEENCGEDMEFVRSQY